MAVDGGKVEAFPTWQMRQAVGGREDGRREVIHWNTNYHAAQLIFGPGLQSMAIREGLRVEHAMLYSKDKSVFGNCKKHQIRGVTSFIDVLPRWDKNSTPGMALRFT